VTVEHKNGPVDSIAASIAALEAQRALLGDAVVDAAIAALQRQLQDRDDTPVPEEQIEAERRTVTVMFADVSGFTALSERLDAEHVRRVMNGCFTALVPVVEHYGGIVDKFIGDEIMAVFGAPVAHENDPERALRAALDMQQALAAFNAREGTSLGLHFGVNTGPVVAGSVGTAARQDYSVLGDAVNLAARLEDASESGEIFVGAATHRLTRALFEFDAPRALSLKGKAQPVEVYRLIGLKTTPDAMRDLSGMTAPLVGRDEELSTLRGALAALATGQGSVVAIRGHAGLGKSRLVAEARQSVANELLWSEGRGLSYAQGTNYSVARDVLYGLLGVKAEDSLARIDLALQEMVRRHAPDRFNDIYPYLGRFLDLRLAAEFEEPLQRVGGELLHALMLGAFSQLVAATAQSRPVVLAFEDMHWSDPSSLRLLGTLLPLTWETRVLLLLAYRPDERGAAVEDEVVHPFDGRKIVIDLQPLSAAQSAMLVHELLAVDDMPDATRALILSRAEGNPFFVEEVLRSLIESGVVRVENGRAVAIGEIESITVPTTLQGILMARLDRLPTPSRTALQTASVIGRLFHERVLAYVRALEERRARSMTASLEELQRREFIHASADVLTGTTAELEWVFKHAVTHDVTYSSLLFERRKQLHGLVGDAIEALFSDRGDELAASLGNHFAHAGRAVEAVRYLTRAGVRAQSTYANAEALAFFRAALEQLDRLDVNATLPETRALLLEYVGDILELQGEHDPSREAYAKALDSGAALGKVTAARLRRKRGAAFVVQRRYPEALSEYQLSSQHLDAPGGIEMDQAEREEWLDLQLALLWMHYWQGQTADMSAIADRYAEDFQKFGSGRQRAHFFMQLLLRNLRRDRYTVTGDTVQLAERLYATLADVEKLVDVPHFAFVVGFTWLWWGALDRAIEQLADALRCGVQVGDVVMQLRCLTYLAVAFRKLNDPSQCAEHARRAYELAGRVKMTEYIAMAQANLAWVAARGGDAARASDLASEALERWHGMPVPYMFDWMAALPLVDAVLSAGVPGEWVSAARMVLAPQQQPLPDVLSAQITRAVSAWDTGDIDEATRLMTDALAQARDGGYA
jgi:class 3 adenylate cyclase